jgi:hypothetical protein
LGGRVALAIQVSPARFRFFQRALFTGLFYL